MIDRYTEKEIHFLSIYIYYEPLRATNPQRRVSERPDIDIDRHIWIERCVYTYMHVCMYIYIYGYGPTHVYKNLFEPNRNVE